MTHIFPVDQPTFEALQGTRRHLFVKDSALYATEDKVLIQFDREQLEFTVTLIEHGPGSKHVNSHYCLIGLYAPYTAIDDVPGSVGGGPKQHDQQ